MLKTKQIWAAVAAFCMIFTLIPIAAFAENVYSGSCGKDLSWEYDDEKRTLTISGTGNMPNYYSRSTEGSLAPWVNSKIKEEIETVVISDGAANIGEYAFFECTGLKSVTIPGSVITINKGAFYNCTALSDITFPSGVASIGDEAFQYCDSLKSVTIPGNVKNIGEGAFYSCGELTKVVIESGTESIGKFAFNYCRKLNDVIISDSVVSIGDNAFQFTGFYNDDSIWDVLYIGNHLIKADDWALNKDKISDCVIKSGTKTIADSAFNGCGGLKSITIPDSMVSIGSHAFEGCSGLTGMVIPKNVINIGDYAFYSCTKMESIDVNADNAAYCSENGILYNKDKTKIIRFPNKITDTSFTIPGSVICIADGAFSGCESLTAVTIPDGTEIIGNDAFNGCTGIVSITVPDGVTILGNKAFYGCLGLTDIAIPYSVICIGEYAFYNCGKLKTVNYTGDKDDWKEIDKGSNYSIYDSIIKYCKSISAERDDNGNIVVKPKNIENGEIVVIALYNGNSVVEVMLSPYDGTKFTFVTSKAYTRAKAMVWSNLDSIRPVCKAKNI